MLNFRPYVIVVIIIFFSIAGCSSGNTRTAGQSPIAPTKALTPSAKSKKPSSAIHGEFSIHLTDSTIKPNQLDQRKLDMMLCQSKSLISSEDILSYQRDNHEIRITPSAYHTIEHLEVPTSGLAYVVCVGDDPIYAGAFWTMLSSQSFDGVTIWMPPLVENAIQIRLGYPGEMDFMGTDPRCNPAVFTALERSGKLE